MLRNYLEIKAKHEKRNKNHLPIYIESSSQIHEHGLIPAERVEIDNDQMKNETDINQNLINERNELQVYLENQLDLNSKLEDTIYKLKMNIKKIERDIDIEISESSSDTPPPPIIHLEPLKEPIIPKKVGRPKKVLPKPEPIKPVKVIENAKIASKKVDI